MKLYGLIGYPLTHSFSQQHFMQKFAQLKLAGYRYDLFPLQHIGQLSALLQEHPHLCGLNVTIPFKQQVIPLLQQLDESAQKVGAVNVIKVRPGAQLTGYNTDAAAFRESIRPLLRSNHQKALILGTGGAASAVASVLRELNIEYLFVSRTPAAGQVSYAELNEAAVTHFPFIINCTPLGMFPHADTCPPLPYDYLTGQNFLYDLVYNPAETLFLAKGKASGALTMNGLDMLHLQAEKAWNIWQQP